MVFPFMKFRCVCKVKDFFSPDNCLIYLANRTVTIFSVNKSGCLDAVGSYFNVSVFSVRISLKYDIVLTFLNFANLYLDLRDLGEIRDKFKAAEILISRRVRSRRPKTHQESRRNLV